jgi:hypothetical protein
MENRTNILNELREISPVVAAISLQNPYTVPAGYFEGLAEQVLQRIQADEAPILSVLPKAQHPFEVPAGYFEGLADQLLKRVKASSAHLSATLQQAKSNPYQVPQGYFETLPDQLLQHVQAGEVQLSAALQQAGNNPYQAPQGYFDNLPATILNRIKADAVQHADEELEMLSPLLKQIGKKMPFSTPAGYFNELTENAMAGAQAIAFVNNELENLSPLMASLQQQQVYEVPAGYFEQFPNQVLNAVQTQQPAKVVSMRFTRRVMQYATAAVVAGVVIVAGWMYFGKTDNGTIVPPVVADKLEKVSDAALENYIENQTVVLPAEAAVPAGSAEIDANDMKEMLADVTDEDLQQYIEKYSTSKDILTN